MAKYSTGSGGSGSGESCELCGASDVSLNTASVAGATLQVCPDCAEHDDQRKQPDDDGRDRDRRAAQNAAKLHDTAAADGEYWEDGADYDDDQLPYLVTDYDDRLRTARQDAGYQLSELAAEAGVAEDDLLALEQGRATQAGVGGSAVGTLETFLDVELVE